MSVQSIKKVISKDDCQKIITGADTILVQAKERPHYYEMSDLPILPLQKNDQDLSDRRFDGLSDTEKESLSLVYNAMYLAKKEVENFYNKKIELFDGGLVKIIKGGSNHLHSDRYMLDGSSWNDGTGREDEYQFSAILYLSEHGKHFEGGDIIFPQHKTTISPEPGLLVFFPGDLDHVHKVNRITSGERFAVVMFMGYRDQPESN